MKEFNISDQVGKKISIKRTRTWRWTTSASGVAKKTLSSFRSPDSPKVGDLALVQVISLGAHESIEQSTGSKLSIFPGSVLVCVFANRYAPDAFEGLVPENIEMDDVDILNAGGTIGRVISRNSGTGIPTKVKVIAFFNDKDGNKINTRVHGRYIKSNNEMPIPLESRRLIIVTGASMNSGKSNSAKAIVYALTSAGHTVVAGKVTGSAAKRDALLMKSAGATDVCDFIDFGYPSTYLLNEDDVKLLFWNMVSYLKGKSDPNSYIVLEIADGIFQREAEMLLLDKDIQAVTSHFVFSCSDSLSALAGYERLNEKFGVKISAISGPSANSPLGLSEVRRFLPNLPTFNNMILDVQKIASIFTHDSPRSIQAVEKKANNIEVIPESFTEDNGVPRESNPL